MPRDPALIGRVWAKLLSNAITFTGKTDEPKITVSGKVEGAEAATDAAACAPLARPTEAS